MTPKERKILDKFLAKASANPNIASPPFDPKAYELFLEVPLNHPRPRHVDCLAVDRPNPTITRAEPTLWKPPFPADAVRAWIIEIGEWASYHEFGEVINDSRLLQKHYPGIKIEGKLLVYERSMLSGEFQGLLAAHGIAQFKV